MMIGIGTPSNQRSAPLAMIASVVVTDNGANLVAVPHPVNRAPPGRTRKRAARERGRPCYSSMTVVGGRDRAVAQGTLAAPRSL